jgi:NitT/TauT family transport system ATP-binding protein
MRIQVKNISFIYINQSGVNSQSLCQALSGVSLEILPGEFVALLGPSGCGKSTLLRILAGLLQPSTGEARLDGKPPQQVLALKQIGWMAQNPSLLPWRTVKENISLAQQINPQNGRVVLSPTELLTLVGLADFSEAYPFTLSSGMQHRAALARTLAIGAKLWLMDEPFAALDELTRETLTDELMVLWMKFQPTVLWVTHNIYEAVRLANRVLIMTPRPGYIHSQLEIPGPQPRNESFSEFPDLVLKLRLMLGTGVHE